MIDFTIAPISGALRWQTLTPVVVAGPRAGSARPDEAEIERKLAPAAAESMQRLDAELAFAANILVEAGFVQPLGAESVPEEGRARIAWNYAYREAVKAWVESDPDWQLIGGVPRFAADVIDAGVAIQVAALAVREGILPLAAAITMHNSSVVFGAMRVHLHDWISGRPQTLAAQRVRASQLKSAQWFPPVAGLVSERLDAGVKVDSIVAEVFAHLKCDTASPLDLPSTDAVRVKVQRVRKARP